MSLKNEEEEEQSSCLKGHSEGMCVCFLAAAAVVKEQWPVLVLEIVQV